MPIQYDEDTMARLLETPSIKEQVTKMTPETLKWYKELLVSQGIYAAFALQELEDQLKKDHE